VEIKRRPEITSETSIAAPETTTSNPPPTDSLKNVTAAISRAGITEIKDSLEQVQQSGVQFPLQVDPSLERVPIGAFRIANEIALQKFEQALPELIGMVGSDGSGATPEMKQQLMQQLANELQKAGIDLDPAKLQQLVDTMAKGGAAGMAVALFICSKIAGNPNLDLNQLSDLCAAYNSSTDASQSGGWNWNPPDPSETSAAQAIIDMASNCYPDPSVVFTPAQLQVLTQLLPSGESNASQYILRIIAAEEGKS